MSAFKLLLTFTATLIFNSCSGPQVGEAQGRPIPPAALSAGYLRQTFATDAFSTDRVDQGQTYKPGFQWYHWNFFGPPIDRSGIRLQPNGVASLTNGYANGNLVTAARSADGKSWHGVAFGGGFYAEAELAFDAAKVDTAKGWPSWWSMAIEHLQQDGSSKWSGGIPGYEHFGELDFMEYLYGRVDKDAYGTNFHDWYGRYNETCPGFCGRNPPESLTKAKAPKGTDWTKFHRFAVRVIPATPVSFGEVRFYMDDRQVGFTLTYRPYSDNDNNMAGWARSAGIIDHQHMVLVLGAGSIPLKVRSVHVWQSSSSFNLTR